MGSGNADCIVNFEISLAPGSLTLYLGMVQGLYWLWVKSSVHAVFSFADLSIILNTFDWEDLLISLQLLHVLHVVITPDRETMHPFTQFTS